MNANTLSKCCKNMHAINALINLVTKEQGTLVYESGLAVWNSQIATRKGYSHVFLCICMHQLFAYLPYDQREEPRGRSLD